MVRHGHKYRKYMRDYYAAHREAWRQNAKRRYDATRLEVFNHYGGPVCVCCGETNVLFLTLDHKNNDGAQHRKRLNYNKHSYGALKAAGFPDWNLQVLCFNCNCGRWRNGGICPHKTV